MDKMVNGVLDLTCYLVRVQGNEKFLSPGQIENIGQVFTIEPDHIFYSVISVFELSLAFFLEFVNSFYEYK